MKITLLHPSQAMATFFTTSTQYLQMHHLLGINTQNISQVVLHPDQTCLNLPRSMPKIVGECVVTLAPFIIYGGTVQRSLNTGQMLQTIYPM